jgi:hypothetical protein
VSHDETGDPIGVRSLELLSQQLEVPGVLDTWTGEWVEEEVLCDRDQGKSVSDSYDEMLSAG